MIVSRFITDGAKTNGVDKRPFDPTQASLTENDKPCILFEAFRDTMCTRADREWERRRVGGENPSKLHSTVECKLHDAIYKLPHLNRTATPIRARSPFQLEKLS